MTTAPVPQDSTADVDITIDPATLDETSSSPGSATGDRPVLSTDPEAQVEDSPVDPESS